MTHATTLTQFEYTPGATSRAKALTTTTTEPDINLLSAHSEKDARKVVLPTMEGLCFEKVKHIAYLEANGNYTSIHFTDKRQILVCKTLREVEALLPQAAFARIHRSHTIHLRHIKKYVRGKGGHVILQNGVILSVSTGQKDAFIDALRCFYRMP